MAQFIPFKAYRPQEDQAEQIASRPYDVVNRQEAREESKGNPHSFFRVVKPEIDFPDEHDPYAPEIYEQGKANFETMIQQGLFRQEDQEQYFVYQLQMGDHRQSGLVGCCAIDDYFDNVIKKHERTRPDKEEDRKNHIRVSKMQYEPVFFAYPQVQEIDRLVEEVKQAEPLFDFTAADGIRHTVWPVADDERIHAIAELFETQVPAIYVADGHHRTAAGALVGRELRDQDEAAFPRAGFFLATLFPDNQLKILDYNRVITDLNGLSSEAFLERLSTHFILERCEEACRPPRLHTFGMYLDGQWYQLTARPHTYDESPIGQLDVTILSKYVLNPILGIKDLRTDKRIAFVGGMRGLGELERRVDSGEMRLAFSHYPISMQQIIDISDNDLLMPPKVTWFEPKLRSGLFVHSLTDQIEHPAAQRLRAEQTI